MPNILFYSKQAIQTNIDLRFDKIKSCLFGQLASGNPRGVTPLRALLSEKVGHSLDIMSKRADV